MVDSHVHQRVLQAMTVRVALPVPEISRIIIFSGVHDMEVNKKIVDLFYEMGIRATNGYLLFPPL